MSLHFRFHVPATALSLRVGHRAIGARSEAFAVERFGTALSCPRSRGPIAARNFSGWCMHAMENHCVWIEGHRACRPGPAKSRPAPSEWSRMGWLLPRSLRGFGGLVPLEAWAVPVRAERTEAGREASTVCLLCIAVPVQFQTVYGDVVSLKLYENSVSPEPSSF